MDDAELVRRCVAGEPAAWDALVARHVGLLHAIVHRVISDPSQVEDVLQSVYLRLWEDGRRRLRSFAGRSRLSTWLAVLARREALDAAERSLSKNRQPTDGGVCSGSFPPGSVPRTDGADVLVREREAEDALLADVAALPPRDRLLVQLVSIDGCSYHDAAQLLDVPENSISPWLSRARDRLAVALRARDGSPYGSRGSGRLNGRSETP